MEQGMLAERFWAKVDPDPDGGCWQWMDRSPQRVMAVSAPMLVASSVPLYLTAWPTNCWWGQSLMA